MMMLMMMQVYKKYQNAFTVHMKKERYTQYNCEERHCVSRNVVIVV